MSFSPYKKAEDTYRYFVVYPANAKKNTIHGWRAGKDENISYLLNLSGSPHSPWNWRKARR